MRRAARLLVIVAVALAVAACGIDHGYVTSKRDVPAHEESYLRQVWVGQSCRTSTSGSGKNKTTTTSCTPNYVYVPDTRHVERACYLTLQNEKESGETAVSCATWDSTKVNDNVKLK